MIQVEQVIAQNLPRLAQKPWLAAPTLYVLRYLLHERRFIEFEQRYPHLTGMEFVAQVLQYFQFNYAVTEREKARIPTTGRLVIIANHPIGSLDGLALLNLVASVRSDLKIIANQLLMNLTPLQNLLLPVNALNGHTSTSNLKRISQFLQHEGVVIFFPAGEVSRLRASGVQDGRWHSGFLRIAQQNDAPLLPIFIHARNSALFYGASMIYKPLAMLLLIREMFEHRQQSIKMKIGELIPPSSYIDGEVKLVQTVAKLQRHLYRLGQGQRGLFQTLPELLPAADKAQLAQAVQDCERLGDTADEKQIYLYRHQQDSCLMREIGRLRELSFRAVGEGTGKACDIDQYDNDYLHLFLWDAKAQEIVGAYRLADTAAIVATKGVQGLYSHALFNYTDKMLAYLHQGLELGRSFVQPRYWGKGALTYLWQGIGAFLTKYPKYRYLFGPVSLSNRLPKAAKDLLIYFYRLYFSSHEVIAGSKMPYGLNEVELMAYFNGTDQRQDFIQLKQLLANMGVGVPTLYKQYADLCEPGGVQFLSFSIDPDFADCVDGLVLVDITQLKPTKRQRYLGNGLYQKEKGHQ